MCCCASSVESHINKYSSSFQSGFTIADLEDDFREFITTSLKDAEEGECCIAIANICTIVHSVFHDDDDFVVTIVLYKLIGEIVSKHNAETDFGGKLHESTCF